MGEAFFVKAAKGAMERTSGRVGSHKASVSISCERSVTNFATNTACRRKLPPLLTCLRGRSTGTNQFRIQASRKKDEEVNGGGLNSNLEVAVPAEQRPVNELTALREGPLGWAGLELPSFIQRLGLVWLTGFFFSCPIAAGSYSPDKDVAEFLLSAGLGATLLQTAVVVRIYTSWSYVAKRLLSAAIEYEETGWYDGQIFLKPPEVLARDRLLGTYEVKPILTNLKLVLYGTMGGLFACTLTLALFDNIQETYASQVPSARRAEGGILYNKFITDMSVLKESDEMAAMEAAAQKGRPGYCGDEYFRALAGGSAETCKKFNNNN